MSYTDLIDIINGDKEAVESFEYENDIVYNVRFVESKPEKSFVTIKFDDEQFYNLFDLSYEDKNFIDAVDSYYGLDFMDDDTLDNEWEQGYLVQQIANQDLIKQIIKNIDPTFDFNQKDDDGMYKTISSMLYGLNEREVEYIKYEYRNVMDRNANIAAQKEIKNDFCGLFKHLKFMERECGEHTYYTTVGNLIRLYELNGNKELDLEELIKEYAEDIDVGELNYYEGMNDLMWSNFNNAEFNESIQGELKRLLESSEEYYDESPNPDELKKMIEIVNKLGGFNEWIDLRPNKEHKIMFTNIDNSDNSLTYKITKKGSTWEAEYRSVNNVEDLNNVIYQPELFENRNKRNKLIMEQITSAEIANEFYNENKNLFNGKATPISHLTNALNKFNQNPKRPKLNLDNLIELSKTKNPLFKFDFYFLQNGRMERPLTTANLQIGKDDKFVLTRIPGNKFIPGIKVNF